MLSWTKIRNKSSVLRKSADYLQQIPRAIIRTKSTTENYIHNPPIIANSFPKSGTHLLLQIIRAFPNKRHYGSFIASMPSVTFRERSDEKMEKLIKKIVPGEILGSHIFFSNSVEKLLDDMHAVHFFIYRDPRDVAISEAYYLTYMNKWHRMHKYYSKQLNSENERILSALKGVSDKKFPYDYPNLRERFNRYEKWLSSSTVMPVKFEDLRSKKRDKVIVEMIKFYEVRTGQKLDYESTIDRIHKFINPSKSHTFRKGTTSNWKKKFDSEQRKISNNILGDLITKLNY